MAFSASFVFKAHDKYSAIIKKITVETKKYNKALSSVRRSARLNKNNIRSFAIAQGKASRTISQSNKNLVAFNRNLGVATKRTRRHTSAIRRMNAVKLKSVRSMGRPLDRGGFSGGMRGGMRGGIASSVLRDISGPMIGMGAGLMAPAIFSSFQARGFETVFADVRKVVGDKLKSELPKLRSDILDLSLKYPISVSEIAGITAAGGRSGIGLDASSLSAMRNELIKFTEVNMQAAVAFDMNTERVSEYLPKIKNAFSLSTDQLSDFGDQVNLLDNTMATSAKVILDNVMRLSGGSALGVSSGDTAALAATLASIGTPDRMVDTIAKRLFTKSASIKNGSSTQQGAAVELMGYSTDVFNKKLLANPMKQLISVLDAANAKGKKSIDILGRMFVPEYGLELSNLAQHVDMLKLALSKVADEKAWRGSMMAEFINKSDTLSYTLQLLWNHIKVGAVIIGDKLNKPIKNLIVKHLLPLMTHIVDFISKNPELVTNIIAFSFAIGGATAAIGALILGIMGLLAVPFVVGIGTMIASLYSFYMDIKSVIDGSAELRRFLGALADFAQSGFVLAINVADSALNSLLNSMGLVSLETQKLKDNFSFLSGASDMLESGARTFKTYSLARSVSENKQTSPALKSLSNTSSGLGSAINNVVNLAVQMNNAGMGSSVSHQVSGSGKTKVNVKHKTGRQMAQ